MYILHGVLAESEHREPNADVAWPEPLRPRPHALTPLWLVTTDDQCNRAAGQAQLQAEWVIVQGLPPPSPYNTVPTDHGSTRWTPKSSSTSCDTQIASRPRGSPRARRRWSTRCPYGGSGTACARQGETPGTCSGTSERTRNTVTPYCTRRTGRHLRTLSCGTRPRTLAMPNSLSPAVTASSIYGPPRCGPSARSGSARRRTMR